MQILPHGKWTIPVIFLKVLNIFTSHFYKDLIEVEQVSFGWRDTYVYCVANTSVASTHINLLK